MRFVLVIFALFMISTPCFAASTSVYAVIDSSGNIVNLVEWDGSTTWSPPSGYTVVLSDGTAQIGGTYNSSTHTFTAAPTKTY